MNASFSFLVYFCLPDFTFTYTYCIREENIFPRFSPQSAVKGVHTGFFEFFAKCGINYMILV